MAKTEHYFTKFEADRFYHVYNRGIDRKPIFKLQDNYEFFLTRIEKYLTPVLDVYSYSLLKEHFHLMIRIHDFPFYSDLTENSEPDIHLIVSSAFRKMFQSYAMAFNKQEKRVGTLFQTPFKRNLVESEEYFTNLILYIHSNPQKHNLIKDFRTYKWNSYLPILNNSARIIHAKEEIDWFGGKSQYIQLHDDQYKKVFTGVWDGNQI